MKSTRTPERVEEVKNLRSSGLSYQKIAACHYTNLQPLWADENLAKG